MAPNFDLRIETPQKLNLPRKGVNAAAIASAIQASIIGVFNKFFSGGQRLVAVALGEMTTPNTKLSSFTPGQRSNSIRFDNDVFDPGEGCAYGDRLTGTQ